MVKPLVGPPVKRIACLTTPWSNCHAPEGCRSWEPARAGSPHRSQDRPDGARRTVQGPGRARTGAGAAQHWGRAARTGSFRAAGSGPAAPLAGRPGCRAGPPGKHQCQVLSGQPAAPLAAQESWAGRARLPRFEWAGSAAREQILAHTIAQSPIRLMFDSKVNLEAVAGRPQRQPRAYALCASQVAQSSQPCLVLLDTKIFC